MRLAGVFVLTLLVGTALGALLGRLLPSSGPHDLDQEHALPAFAANFDLDPDSAPLPASYADLDLFSASIGDAPVEALKREFDARRELRESRLKKGREAVPELIEAASDADPIQRWEAVDLLGRIGDERAIPILAERVLHEEDPHARWRSIWALNRFDGEAALTHLRKGLHAGSQQAAWNAAIALASRGEPDALPLLHGGLTNEDPFVRWEAANALGKVHDDMTLPALISALEAGEAGVAGEAALSLGKIGDRKALPALLEALASPHSETRTRAATALARMGDSGAIPRLQDRVERETNKRARAVMAGALDALKRNSKGG